MENTKVLNVKISYNKNFTIFWSVLVDGIYQIKLYEIDIFIFKYILNYYYVLSIFKLFFFQFLSNI